MRAIKFRYIQTDDIRTRQNIFTLSDIERCLHKNGLGIKSIDRCTGLKDDEGIEIYEGDIVCDRFEKRYAISFENGMFVCDYDALFWLIEDNGPVRVIGNIYQNPELLEA